MAHQAPPKTRPLQVVMLSRYRLERAYSIEAVFDTIATHLPGDIALRQVSAAYPSRGLWPRIRAAWEARRACRGADVIHMTGDSHYLVAFLPRRRTVLTVHDCEVLDRNKGLKRAVLWFFWYRLPGWRVRALTVVSAESKAQLQRWLRFDPKQIFIIENPLSKPIERVDRPFNDLETRLLMIGTEPNKNIERVAQALAGLPVTLHVVGRLAPDRLARLRACVPLENTYDLSDADLAAAYGAADIVLFPSLSEGFGLPILEGQAAGRPVITSNRAPMSDVAGPGAVLVDPEDAGAIRGAVERVRADPALRKGLVAAGRSNVRRFAPATAAAAYGDLYRQIAGAV